MILLWLAVIVFVLLLAGVVAYISPKLFLRGLFGRWLPGE